MNNSKKKVYIGIAVSSFNKNISKKNILNFTQNQIGDYLNEFYSNH